MKIRAGHITNSSSSSFCVITSKKAHEAAVKATKKAIDPENVEDGEVNIYGSENEIEIGGQKIFLILEK